MLGLGNLFLLVIYFQIYHLTIAQSPKQVFYLKQGDKIIPDPDFSGNRETFKIYCYAGKPKSIIHLWQSVSLEIALKSDNYVYYEGSTPNIVWNEYVEHRSGWSINLFSLKPKHFRFDPFNQSCIGIDSKEYYQVILHVIRVDYWKILYLTIGTILFFSADKLSKNVLFYYLCGVSFGICASFLILIYFLSKLFPKRPVMYGVAVCGWTIGVYILQMLWENIRVIVVNYQNYVIWYLFSTGFISFVVCYRWGPVTNERTKNLIRWSLQTLGLVAIFNSSQFQEAAMGQIVLILLLYNFPKTWLSKSKTYWKRKFPPKVSLLTNAEYYQQGVRETSTALESLRKYCSSPECNQWQTALKLKDIKRFASFVEGASHLSDDEILEYETSIHTTDLTDDEDEMLTDEEMMVRNYIKKRNRPDIPKDDLKKAVNAVLNRQMPFRMAASTFNMPKSTLYDQLVKIKRKKNLTDSGNESSSSDEDASSLSKYATRQIFSPGEEKQLEIYLKQSSKIFYGLTYKSTWQLAYEYASKLGKKIPDTWSENNMAGMEWMRSFMSRHPRLSYRKAENTSITRAVAFNKINVASFFKNYAEVQAKYNFPPNLIWNTHETGITTVLQTPKVIAETGTKGVGQCVSAERGVLVTICGFISAVGNTIPPAYVFPRVRMKEQFIYGSVPGAIGFAEKSGWMSSKIFLQLLEHIQKHTGCIQANPILLLLDNHETHTSLEAIDYSRENGIVLLSFPPHCTHKMQPLGRGIYGPFKTRCKAAFNDFMISNPGKPIGIYDIAKLTADPYLQSFTPKNIISSYASTGLWPINSMIFNDDDFMGSFATDRADPEIRMKECELPSTSITPYDSFTLSISMSTSNAADSEIDEVTMMIRTMLNDSKSRYKTENLNIICRHHQTITKGSPQKNKWKVLTRCHSQTSRRKSVSTTVCRTLPHLLHSA